MRASQLDPIGPRTHLLLRVLVLLGVCTAVALGGTGAGHAAPQADETPQTRVAQQLARSVEARVRALETLDRKAAAWSRTLAARAATYAALGYTGDVEEATHVRPLSSYRVSASFGAAGPLWERDHTGQDLGAAQGTPLVAVADGVVTEVGDAGPYGLRTILTLADGTEVWYSHQSVAFVAVGDQIEMAEPIGQVGSTGNSTGPHLHLEVRPDGGTPVDPAEWLHSHGVAL